MPTQREKVAVYTPRRAASGEPALPTPWPRPLACRRLLEPTGLWHLVTGGPGHEHPVCSRDKPNLVRRRFGKPRRRKEC